jgi:BNR repeat-like domain
VVLLPDGILGCYSSDGGQSWGPGEVLNDFPRTSDFDPAFIADGKRTWFFLSAGRWNRYPFARGDNAIGAESFKIFHRYSDDSGRSWSESRVAFEKCGCRSNGIKLSSGELLLPIYGFVKRSSGVLKSSDAGKTWNRFGDVSTPVGSVEPTIAELSSGAVVMFLRTGDGLIWRSFSKDKEKPGALRRRRRLSQCNRPIICCGAAMDASCSHTMLHRLRIERP